MTIDTHRTRSCDLGPAHIRWTHSINEILCTAYWKLRDGILLSLVYATMTTEAVT